MKKLLVETPSPELVDGYLTEISQAYGVKWSASIPQVAVRDEAGKTVGVASLVIFPLTYLLDDLPPMEEEEQKASTRRTNSTTTSTVETPADDFETLARRFQELKKR